MRWIGVKGEGESHGNVMSIRPQVNTEVGYEKQFYVMISLRKG